MTNKMGNKQIKPLESTPLAVIPLLIDAKRPREDMAVNYYSFKHERDSAGDTRDCGGMGCIICQGRFRGYGPYAR